MMQLDYNDPCRDKRPRETATATEQQRHEQRSNGGCSGSNRESEAEIVVPNGDNGIDE